MLPLAYAALCVFVFVLPWESVLVLPGMAVVSRGAGMIALGLALLAVVISGRVRRWHTFHTAAFFFVMWAGCDLLFFGGGQRLPFKYYTFVQLFLVLWMIWELTPQKRRVLGLMTAYVVGAHVAALDTILVYRKMAGTLRRYTAGGDPNDLAMTLALALPMAWYLGMNHNRAFVRWICRAYLPIGLVAIGLTGSRGGMLTSIVALLIVPLSMRNLSPGKLATAIAMLGLSGALAVANVPDKIVERLASTSTEVEDLRIGGRFKLWVGGVHAFSLRPMTGYGTASYRTAIYPWLGDASQVAHNSYLSVLVEQGLVGFFFYIMMFIAVFRAVRKLPSSERRFALILMATLGIAMMPLTWEDRRPVWFVLAALIGLTQARDAARAAPRLASAGGAGPGAVRWPVQRPRSLAATGPDPDQTPAP
jgi:O-antigen ligase